MKAVISVDYTYDFVADEGKLTVGKPAQLIETAIAEVTEAAFNAGDFIVFAIDCHEEKDTYHPETRLFPPHNLKHSAGRNLYGQLGDFYKNIKTRNRYTG